MSDSIADMIPKWFEGGTTEQMLDEALAQIRLLEARLTAPEAPLAMTEERARTILKQEIQEDGRLYNLGWYLAWSPDDNTACLDGEFDEDDLEAIAWWMRNRRSKPQGRSPE